MVCKLNDEMKVKKISLEELLHEKEKVVDIFTKPLPRETFEYLRQKLGVISLSPHQ
jgi:hypothetical protein